MNPATRNLVLGVLLGCVLGFGGGFLAGGEEARPAVILPSRESAASPSAGAGAGTALAPLPRQDETSTRSLAPRSEVATPSVSERALSAAAEPRSAAARSGGQGTIGGHVRTVEGTAIEAALVRAVRKLSAPDFRAADVLGSEPAPLADLDDAIRQAAEQVVTSRAGTFETTTGPDGTYLLEGLPEGRYALEVYRAEYAIRSAGRSSEVSTGSALDFLAHPVLAVDVSVVDGTGAPIAEALLECSDESGAPRIYQWRHGQSLRLTAGIYQLAASAERVDPGRGRQPVTRLRSPNVDLVLRAGLAPAPVVLELAPRTGVYGEVILPSTDVVGRGVPHVYLAPLEGAAELDPAQLQAISSRDSRIDDGTYAILDLEPGRYVIGVVRGWGEPVAMHEIIELGQKLLHLDLELPPVDASEYLAVLALGPDGSPLQELAFTFFHEHDNGSSSSGLHGMRDESGRHLISVPDMAREAYAGEGTGHEFRLTARHTRYGERTVTLAAGQRSVELAFADPATLEVSVTGYAGSGCEGRLYVSATLAGASDRSFLASRDKALGPGGVHTIEHLEPGSYVVALQLVPREAAHLWERSEIASTSIDLRSGRNAVRLALPPLYSLPVRAPGMSAGTTVRLVIVDETRDDRSSSHRSSRRAKLDEGGRCVIDDLPAGRYRAICGGRSAQVEVPGDEAVLEETPP